MMTPIKHNLKTDWFLVTLVVLIFIIGLIALYSAGGEERFFTQLKRGIGGIFLMLIIGRLPSHMLQNIGFVMCIGVILLLILVLMFGVKINNVRRWLNIGFYFQPSELMKVLLPVGLAYYYHHLPTIRFWHHVTAIIIITLATFLVLKQPDFGTATLIASAGLFTLFFVGISWLWITSFTILGVLSLPTLWYFVLKPYQQKRVLTLLDPYQDPLGAGYHTIQSKIAVGSGGLWGKGFQSGTQAQLGFLPERHTDFIFAVYAEEFGLVGASILLFLVFLLTCRCLYTAKCANSRFGACSAAGIITVFFMTFIINLSMVSGLLPVVGMPLPLISYGGTALLANFIGFGFILAIAKNRLL